MAGSRIIVVHLSPECVGVAPTGIYCCGSTANMGCQNVGRIGRNFCGASGGFFVLREAALMPTCPLKCVQMPRLVEVLRA